MDKKKTILFAGLGVLGLGMLTQGSTIPANLVGDWVNINDTGVPKDHYLLNLADNATVGKATLVTIEDKKSGEQIAHALKIPIKPDPGFKLVGLNFIFEFPSSGDLGAAGSGDARYYVSGTCPVQAEYSFEADHPDYQLLEFVLPIDMSGVAHWIGVSAETNFDYDIEEGSYAETILRVGLSGTVKTGFITNTWPYEVACVPGRFDTD